MNEQDFRNKFISEKELYLSWGNYIKDTLLENNTLYSLLKMPISVRVKDIESLVNKAFYRKKSYKDPYNDITDKVGLRIVVLLSDDIKNICDVIVSNPNWRFSEDRNFEDEREENPNIFTYQSVHYVLTNLYEFRYKNVLIPSGITCEVQIRTLLQHSYSELTHDTIYKSKISTEPIIHRKIARSMALIEATDELFCDVTNQINIKAQIITSYMDLLTTYYIDILKQKNLNTQINFKVDDLNISILDQYINVLQETQLNRLRAYIKDNFELLADIVNDYYIKNKFYQQPIILFLIYMVSEEKFNAKNHWDISLELLEQIANSIGETINNI